MLTIIRPLAVVIWGLAFAVPLPLMLINPLAGIGGALWYILLIAAAIMKVRSINRDYERVIKDIWVIAAGGQLDNEIKPRKGSSLYQLEAINLGLTRTMTSYVNRLKEFLSWAISATSEIYTANQEMEKGYTGISSATIELKETFDSTIQHITEANKTEDVEKSNKVLSENMSILNEIITRVNQKSEKGFENVNDVTKNNDRMVETIAAAINSPDGNGDGTKPAAMSQFNEQFNHFQDDAPACDVCGSICVRNGTCYRCFNCGNSMGCS